MALGAWLALPAGAYNLESPRFAWPGRPAVIRYHSDLGKPRHFAVSHATFAWSHSGVRLRFRSTSAKRAGLLIKSSPKVPCGNGFTSLSVDPETHRPHGRTKVHIGTASPFGGGNVARRCRYIDTIVIAHELGHAIGLDHQDGRCAVMNTTNTTFGKKPLAVAPSHCHGGAGKWYCRVLAIDDLRGAKKLYGGNPKVRNPEFCPT